MLSANIVVSSTNIQERPSGDTPLPSPKEVTHCSTPSPRKEKAIKDSSSDIQVSLDDVIEMPQFDFANLTLEQTILLQEILVKKKKQEEPLVHLGSIFDDRPIWLVNFTFFNMIPIMSKF